MLDMADGTEYANPNHAPDLVFCVPKPEKRSKISQIHSKSLGASPPIRQMRGDDFRKLRRFGVESICG